jgi:periplasmic mercuric ion binding protein
MKKIITLLVAVIIINIATNAQVMGNQKATWITIKSNNLKCWECKNVLLNFMVKEVKANYENGIMDYVFNLVKGEVRIKYIPDRITPDDIRLIFNEAGFDADDTKAEEGSYKKLPPTCKRTEDGGGPKKGSPCHVDPN